MKLPPRPPDPRRLFVALVVLVVALPGCLQRPGAGVSVRALAADLVFGIPPLPPSVPPPNIETEPQDPLGLVVQPRQRDFTPPVVGDIEACKEAGPTDFPEEAAPTVIETRPKVGTYTWVVEGQQKLQGGTATITINDFVTRQILQVGSLGASGDFVFTTAERELVAGSDVEVRQSFQVIQSRTGPTAPNENGLFLTKVERRRSGQPPAVFEPLPAIKMITLPVRGGPIVRTTDASPQQEREVNQVGVDPNSFESLEHQGVVEGRRQIDACGTVIDSWFVNGSQTFTNNRGQRTTRNYDYSIGTHFGGIIVFEHIESPLANPTLVLDIRIGQLEPD